MRPEDIGAAESHRNLALAYVKQGRFDEAVQHFAEVLKLENNDAGALLFMASYCLQLGDADMALALYDQLLRVSPQLNVGKEGRKVADRYIRIREKNVEFLNRIISGNAESGGKNSSCLIELNGDLLWLPGDLLKFLWHTVQQPIRQTVPSFMAETEHYVWIKEHLKQGDVVFDLGANIGIFAAMMAAKVGPSGQVHAFEPSAVIAESLSRVLVLNNLHNVVINRCAVSDSNGSALFLEVLEQDVRRESSHLSAESREHMSRGLQHNEIEVQTVTLDSYSAAKNLRPALIKIDVEGAEFEVLEGARQVIGSTRPLLVIEIHPAADGSFDYQRLETYLRQFGYQHSIDRKEVYCWQQ